MRSLVQEEKRRKRSKRDGKGRDYGPLKYGSWQHIHFWWAIPAHDLGYPLD